MEALLLYQIKVAVLVAVFFAGYRLLLGRETFHRFNRTVLITIAILSFVLPMFHITRQSTGSVEPVNGQGFAKSIFSVPYMFNILLVMYGAGFLFVLIKKGISVWAMSRIIQKGRYADRSQGVDVIESDQIPQPLNWMRFIVMPREWLESENASVWEHENLHARRWHSLDLLMADVMTAFQWFNPVMILLRKEFELIHEFEADRAVIDSGANPKEYKLMLVSAVAASRGMAMTSWLKQSNLKKRIDMMDKKQSNGWGKLRVLFIPVIAYSFLFATANVNVVANEPEAEVLDDTFQWPEFEDGKTWLFQDGTAKVKTYDGVEASMQATQVADYLKNYTGYKTTRMTLMFEYPIESLADVQPYAEQLNAVGIKTSVATNDEMLARMTMPEFRVARVYDEGNGKYRFEVICNSHEDRLTHFMTNGQFKYKYKDMSITGDKALMLKWIDMFDGHGLAIYPKTSMPCADMEQMAQAAWDRGIEQVSAVLDVQGDRMKQYTPIPKGRNLSQEYPGRNAADVIRKINDSRSKDYFDKGLHIANPRSFYNAGGSQVNVTDVIRTPNELILVFKSIQLTDLWIMTDGKMAIEVDGRIYISSKYEGLNDLINIHYWSPDNGFYIWNVHFNVAIPDNINTVNVLTGENSDEVLSGLQISDTPVNYDNVRVVMEGSSAPLTTTHKEGAQAGDIVFVNRIDFTDQQTKFYAGMSLAQSHSFPGHLSSDITLTLSDGQIIKPIKVTGVPLDEDFDRHGDYVTTGFNIIFPPISQEDWSKGMNLLKLNVCHEPVSIPLNRPRPGIADTKDIAPGKYNGMVVYYELADNNAMNNSREEIKEIEVGTDGKITITGSQSSLFRDGKYTWKRVDNKKNQLADLDTPFAKRYGLTAQTGIVRLKGKKVDNEFYIQELTDGIKVFEVLLINIENEKKSTILYFFNIDN